MIEPHGGDLIDRVADPSHADRLRTNLDEAPTICLDRAQLQDVINIANGRFSPLTGFMSKNDFRKVVHDMTLEDGTRWSLPVTLDVDAETARELTPGEMVSLESPDRTIVAALDIDDVYKYNHEETAEAIYGTTDRQHPGVRNHLEAGDFLIGGDVRAFDEFRYNDHDLLPKETRVLFNDLDWETVVGFQTRNAPHRAHEYIQKSALEHTDGVLIQPKLGYKKSGDYKDDVIFQAYRRLVEHYYVDDSVVLSAFPSQMRYAGPREAIFDAIVRKNQGCTHFVVGRDHAGVKDYYDGFDAHRIFDDINHIGIEPLFYSYSFYCRKCDGMVSEKICPHTTDQQVHPSGTRIRELIQSGEKPSEKMMRPEVSAYLLNSESPFVEHRDLKVTSE
jgi:sulfate adenylyltransferase